MKRIVATVVVAAVSASVVPVSGSHVTRVALAQDQAPVAGDLSTYEKWAGGLGPEGRAKVMAAVEAAKASPAADSQAALARVEQEMRAAAPALLSRFARDRLAQLRAANARLRADAQALAVGERRSTALNHADTADGFLDKYMAAGDSPAANSSGLAAAALRSGRVEVFTQRRETLVGRAEALPAGPKEKALAALREAAFEIKDYERFALDEYADKAAEFLRQAEELIAQHPASPAEPAPGGDGAGHAGKDGRSPRIGANGNWWIGETDTGVAARGGVGAGVNPILAVLSAVGAVLAIIAVALSFARALSPGRAL